MNTKICVGNLSATTTERDLENLCFHCGNVAEVNIPYERESGQPRGFAIVTMATPQGAQAAILALNGKELEARVLTVAEHVPTRKEPPATGQNRKVPGSMVRQKVSPFSRLLGRG